MKYKVGDKVRIVNERTDGMNISGKMDCYLGQVMTIEYIDHDNYRMKEDDEKWVWGDNMIQGYADDFEPWKVDELEHIEKNCEDCKARIKAETLKGFEDLGKLYSEIRADVIDEILSNTKTIVDEDGIIFEAVLVKDIKKKMQDCTIERTLENCSLIRKMKSQPNQYDGKCEGFAGDTDEPCEMCKECKLNVWHED